MAGAITHRDLESASRSVLADAELEPVDMTPDDAVRWEGVLAALRRQ
jgi:hypothetical protein